MSKALVPPGLPNPSATQTAKLAPAADAARAGVALLIVLGSVAIFYFFGRPPAPERRSDERPQVPVVRTIRAESYEGAIEIVVEGVVKPFRRVKLAAEVAGRVQRKAPECEEANYVTKGALLFELDPTDYELAVRRSTKLLEQANHALQEWQVEKSNTERQLELAEADAQLAAREVSRLRNLAAGISTAAELDQAQRIELTSRNAVMAQRNQLRLLDARYERTVSARDLQQVELDRANRDLERTRVFAPCDGTIVSEDVEQDGYVQSGQTLVVINDTYAAEVVCQLELDDMFWLWGTRTLPKSLPEDDAPGPASEYQFPRWPVTVEFEFQDFVCAWEGTWERYGGTGIDLQTRTVPCQILVKQPRRGVLRRTDAGPVGTLPAPAMIVGMFVTVRSQVTPHLPLINVSAEALRPGSTVWVVRDGRLQVLPVKLARRTADSVLLHATEDGVRPGDRVVVSPLPFVSEGMNVREETTTQ